MEEGIASGPASEQQTKTEVRECVPLPAHAGKRIVAIGDLHGNYQALERLLGAANRAYGLFDPASSSRLAPDALLVFTGDYIDRMGQGRDIIRKLRYLSWRNPGQVKTLVGNHELLALEHLGEAHILSGYPDMDGFDLYSAYRGTGHGRNGGASFISEFGVSAKDAFRNYVDCMSRTGPEGKWVRSLLPSYETAVAGKRFLFVHADLPEALRERESLDEYLFDIEEHLATDTVRLGGHANKYGHDLIKGDGLFWDRSFEGLEKMDATAVATLVGKLGVDYLVTGHTPHALLKSYADRIFDIDVGMGIRGWDAVPQALVIDKRGIHGFKAEGEYGTEARLVTFP